MSPLGTYTLYCYPSGTFLVCATLNCFIYLQNCILLINHPVCKYLQMPSQLPSPYICYTSLPPFSLYLIVPTPQSVPHPSSPVCTPAPPCPSVPAPRCRSTVPLCCRPGPPVETPLLCRLPRYAHCVGDDGRGLSAATDSPAAEVRRRRRCDGGAAGPSGGGAARSNGGAAGLSGGAAGFVDWTEGTS